MNPFSNALYLLPPLIAGISSFVLLALVLLKGRKSSSTRIFGWLLVSVGLTSFFIFAMRLSPDIQRALLWQKPVMVVSWGISLFYYHFTVVYTNARLRTGILPSIYALVILFAVLGSTTNLLLEGVRLEYYGYAPIFTTLGLFLFASSSILYVAGAYNLIKGYKRTTSYAERNRLLYLAIAILFPVLGGFIDGLTNLPPAFIWGNLMFCIVCTIAIVRYRLLDIRVAIRKSLVYLLVSVVIAIPYVGVLFLLTRVLQPGIELWWVHVIVILLLAVALRPVYSWAQKLVDRLFYRDRYDYLRALQRFSHQAQSIVDLKELGSTMVQLINSALRSSSTFLLLRDEAGDLTIVSSTRKDNPQAGIVLRGQSFLVKWLKLHDRILTSVELEIIPELQSLTRADRENLEKLWAELFVPIKTRAGQLSGVLVLGQKLSQQPYSNEDKELLAALSSQMAAALENARLYSASRQEVAERKRNEKELRLKAELLDAATDMISLSDLDGNFIYVNEAFCRILSYSRDELTRIGLETLLTPEYAKLFKPRRETLLKKGKASFESAVLRKDGAVIPVEVHARIIKSGGKNLVLSVIHDITERKQTEAKRRELEQKAQLASRLASVGEMASGVAHEINNPLTGVIGYTKLLKKSNIPEDARRYAETINDSANRVASIVKRLLAFARQHKAERVYVHINEIITTTLAMRAYEMETSNINVITQLDPDLPGTMADASQLQQVFLNIIINAETEMTLAHGMGNLFIKTETIDNIIRITFKDDGPGIAKNNLQKVFHPFFTTRGVGEGTGLGLSVCHGIVVEHNGRIYVESELGKGATFIVELPIEAEENQPQLARVITTEVGKANGRILVVDDEQLILQYLDEELTEDGYEVETIDNANDALERIKIKTYDAILLDIKMPGMSGIELYNRIQKIDKSLAKRLVFITGDVRGLETQAFLSETKVSFIAKPFDIELLKWHIKTILAQDT